MSKILIVDFEIDSREMLCILLKKDGFETEFVNTRKQFCEKINDFKPEIVLLSDTIPNTVEMIRDNYVKTMDIPKCIVITNTRFSKREQKILFNELNVVDFVKPDSIVDELTNTIQKHL